MYAALMVRALTAAEPGRSAVKLFSLGLQTLEALEDAYIRDIAKPDEVRAVLCALRVQCADCDGLRVSAVHAVLPSAAGPDPHSGNRHALGRHPHRRFQVCV